MARSSRSSRPAARPAAPASSRSASTAAYPSAASSQRAPPAPAPPAHNASHPQAAAPAQASQPGMIAQMAATAGSVAVGSTIGHGLSSMLFGGRSEAAPAPAPEAAAPVNQNNGFARGVSCENQAKEFTLCLEKAPYESCTYYLEQLKACQAAAAPY